MKKSKFVLLAALLGTISGITPLLAAGGFPAMTGNIPFLMKDLVLLAVSFYLLKQDLMRVSLAARPVSDRLDQLGRQRERAAA